ncbi:MAG: DUF6516 family protein [Desulfuromonadaceae bacterium]|jgi:hypothetical protein|nr:DUF6516 family protein [Desulfuromonadaceae bacterium]
MKRKATLVIERKQNLADGSIIQAVVWELPVPLPGSRHRFKYRLYYGKSGTCLVRFDNEQGKGDHQHINGNESPYQFKDIPTLISDFRSAIKECEEPT